MSDPTTTPTPTETLRERVRGALATVPLGEDDVHVFYVAEKHLDRLADAVLAAVSAAAPEEPRQDPVRGEWARLDESPSASAQMIAWHAPKTAAALAARPAPVVSGEAVEAGGRALYEVEGEGCEPIDNIGWQREMEPVRVKYRRKAQAVLTAALGITVADAPAADDEGGQER